jgi:hypothetical protein
MVVVLLQSRAIAATLFKETLTWSLLPGQGHERGEVAHPRRRRGVGAWGPSEHCA